MEKEAALAGLTPLLKALWYRMRGWGTKMVGKHMNPEGAVSHLSKLKQGHGGQFKNANTMQGAADVWKKMALQQQGAAGKEFGASRVGHWWAGKPWAGAVQQGQLPLKPKVPAPAQSKLL